jgi:hypothetical protein
VQRDEQITGFERCVGDGAGAESEAVGETVLSGDPVAECHEFGAGLDAGDVGAFAEESGDGEGEVAFAGTCVDDAEWSVER